MNKVWESIFDVFVGILIMFISVTVYFGLRTESVIKSMYEGITEEFVTDVKRSGVFTLEDYEKYMERMGLGNSLFNISFEHRYKIYEPEYRFKTLEEIIAEQNNAYTGANDYHYRDVVTQKPHVDDPINDGNLNTETNESILAKVVDTPAASDHVHDENCYGGHKHSGEPMFTHTHKHGYNCIEFETSRYVYFTCAGCGEKGVCFLAAWYWDETTNSAKFSQNITPFCGNCGSYSLGNTSYKSNYSYSCGYSKDINGDGYTDAVGYDNTYEYMRTNAPSDLPSGTHTSGCYTYHKTKNMDFDINNENSIKSAFSKMMHTDNFQGYCKIPEYITIGISTSVFLSDADISDRPNLCRVVYKAYVAGNKQIRFKFSSYAYTDYGWEWTSGTDNPGFPADISVVQLKSYNRPTINDWFKTLFRQNYSNVNNGDINFHLYWMDRRWNGNGYYSWLEDKTQYLNVCEFDHSLGVDKWLTTCGLEEDGTIDCNKIIVSLTPTHSTQTVYTNDSLITTAKAIYKDGSEKTVVCITDFDTSFIGKDQTVTLVYSYMIGEVAFTKTCMIEVTVIPRNKTCTHGHIYNLNDDGSDPGCPYCRAWVESLRVINPTTSPIVITIGTTLQNNNVVLLATYMDGHTEEVRSGYIDNLDTLYLGTKPVTIGYKGASVTVLVTTKCATMICDICGYEYNLYPDGTNPGCPRCISKIPVFTGNIMEYDRINHTEEILDALYKKRQYVFNVDDAFSITVTNKSSTVGRKFLRNIYPSLTDRWLHIEKRAHVMSK